MIFRNQMLSKTFTILRCYIRYGFLFILLLFFEKKSKKKPAKYAGMGLGNILKRGQT